VLQHDRENQYHFGHFSLFFFPMGIEISVNIFFCNNPEFDFKKMRENIRAYLYTPLKSLF